MDWESHEMAGRSLECWMEDYESTLRRFGLMKDSKRLEYYNDEDYDINDDGFMIWDNAIWLTSLQWLMMQPSKEIDYQKLYDSFTDDNPEKIHYLRDHNDYLEGWEMHLQSTIDYFIEGE